MKNILFLLFLPSILFGQFNATCSFEDVVNGNNRFNIRHEFRASTRLRYDAGPVSLHLGGFISTKTTGNLIPSTYDWAEEYRHLAVGVSYVSKFDKGYVSVGPVMAFITHSVFEVPPHASNKKYQEVTRRVNERSPATRAIYYSSPYAMLNFRVGPVVSTAEFILPIRKLQSFQLATPMLFFRQQIQVVARSGLKLYADFQLSGVDKNLRKELTRYKFEISYPIVKASNHRYYLGLGYHRDLHAYGFADIAKMPVTYTSPYLCARVSF